MSVHAAARSFPAQCGLEWSDEKKPNHRWLIKENQCFYQLDMWIFRLKFNNMNSDLQIYQELEAKSHLQPFLDFCPFHASLRKSRRRVTGWTISILLILRRRRELLVFLQYCNHKRESQPVTINWVNAGEEHYGIKQENKGRLHESHISNTPSRPKQTHQRAPIRCACNPSPPAATYTNNKHTQ